MAKKPIVIISIDCSSESSDDECNDKAITFLDNSQKSTCDSPFQGTDPVSLRGFKTAASFEDDQSVIVLDQVFADKVVHDDTDIQMIDNDAINVMSMRTEQNQPHTSKVQQLDSQEEYDKWANSLVGRWWEIYWDPTGGSDVDRSAAEIASNSGLIETTDLDLSTKSNTRIINDIILLSEQQCNHTPLHNTPELIQTSSFTIKKINALYTTSLLGLGLQQITVPTSSTTCHSSTRIMSGCDRVTEHQQKHFITIKSIAPNAPNRDILQPNDILTGINGISFNSQEFQSGNKHGINFFNRIIKEVKEAKRPLLVNFERLVRCNPESGMVKDSAIDQSLLRADITAMVETSTAIAVSNQDIDHKSADGIESSSQINKASIEACLVTKTSNEKSRSNPKPNDDNSFFPLEPAEGCPQGWMSQRFPRVSSKRRKVTDVYYYSPIMKYKFRSKPEVRHFLGCLQRTDGEEEQALEIFHSKRGSKVKAPRRAQKNLPLQEEISQEKLQRQKHLHQSKRKKSVIVDSIEADDIDWYDAKIISHDHRMFEVQFLGDEEGVTYKMALSSKLVRPSVRAWAKRSHALIDYDEDFMKVKDDFNSWLKRFKLYLPQSTKVCIDSDDCDYALDARDGGMYHHDTRNRTVYHCRRKLAQYQRIISLQLDLAKLLSPSDDDDEEYKNEDCTEVDSIPGPFTTSSQVKYLCAYLSELETACKWLLSQDVSWILLKNLSSITTLERGSIKFPKETVHSFLVDGTKALNRLTQLDTEKMSSIMKTKHDSRCNKCQCPNSSVSVPESDSFEECLLKTLISDDSLKNSLTLVESQCWKRKRAKCIDLFVSHLLHTTYESLWRPTLCWIATADDVAEGKLQRSYSVDEINQLLLASKNDAYLSLIDLSLWTLKLQEKISQVQLFEGKVLRAIKACTQMNIQKNSIISTEVFEATTTDDSCLKTLYHLKSEADMSPIRNINPLGTNLIASPSVEVSPSLTRSVIDDAIAVRTWVIDFIHIKLVRERSFFVKDVIQRYALLPKLPVLPYSTFDGNTLGPLTELTEITEETILILSADCSRYNDIIANFDFRLQKSMKGLIEDDSDQETSLLSKACVSSALAELKRLPILSEVEEKLCVRDELIDWDMKALDMIRISDSAKIPFNKIEALYTDLLNIIATKSEVRARICKHLKENKAVENAIQIFAIENETIVCAESAKWVRGQYRKAITWKKQCEAIISALQSHGFFSQESLDESSRPPAVDIEDITSLVNQYNDKQFFSLFHEYSTLDRAIGIVREWSNNANKLLLSESLPLVQRYRHLITLSQSRPKGILMKPTEHDMHIWISALSWHLKLREGVELAKEKLDLWRTSDPVRSKIAEAENLEIMNIVRANLGVHIVKGQNFLLMGDIPPIILDLKNEAIQSISEDASEVSAISLREIFDSTIHGKALLSFILNINTDRSLGSPLLITCSFLWQVMVKLFLQRIPKNNSCVGDESWKGANLSNAKILLSMRPRESCNSFSTIESKTDDIVLEQMIHDADELHHQATATLSQTSELLHSRIHLETIELQLCLKELLFIQTKFIYHPSQTKTPSNLLLKSTGLIEKIDFMIDVVQWLLNTLSYPILWYSMMGSDIAGNKYNRVSLNELEKLSARVPYFMQQLGLGTEFRKIAIFIQQLFDHANTWKIRYLSMVAPSTVENQCSHDKKVSSITDLSSIKEFSGSSILSMVIMPEENELQEILTNACLMKESLVHDFFTEHYNFTDVKKSKFPDKKSLVGENDEFSLFHLSGSDMYIHIQNRLQALIGISEQLMVTTPEKATYLWICNIYKWVESLCSAVTEQNTHDNSACMKWIIHIRDALQVEEFGNELFHNILNEVNDTLVLQKILIQNHSGTFSVTMMKGGVIDSPGAFLIRWAVMLFESLKADLKRISVWRESALKSIYSFPSCEKGGKISTLLEHTNVLIKKAKDLFIQDEDMLKSLLKISEKIMTSESLKMRLDHEMTAFNEECFTLEQMKFDGASIVDYRYNLLDSLISRSSSISSMNQSGTQQYDNRDTLFAGQLSTREKSCLFLQKSLLQGMETFGMEMHKDAHDYCVVLAWDLEQAIFDMFKSNDNVCNDYREKVRCLRFNLQDPKNPMLCARVLSNHLKISEIVSMSSEELASKEMNLFRRQLQVEAMKNVLISNETIIDSQSVLEITSDQAQESKVENAVFNSTDSTKMQTWNSRKSTDSTDPSETYPKCSSLPVALCTNDKCHHTEQALSVFSLNPYQGNDDIPSETPSHSITFSTLNQPFDYETSLPSITNYSVFGHHIISKSGSDIFSITVSRLSISFTTKLFIDQSSIYDVDNFLPESLVEKGRITVNEFNKFVSDKMKNGKWNLVHLKLSSIVNDSDLISYKKLYKDYESIGRICMINVSDSTKIFLVTPKFLRVCICMTNVNNMSRTSTYAVILTKDRIFHNKDS